MSKERYLTVLVPITDDDCEATVYASLAALQSAVPASVSNTDKIYKVNDGTYYRSTVGSGSSYSYQAVTDREFPSIGAPLEVFDFTYDATRMGTAPTISAQGVMRYADKDGDGNDVTLEGKWSQRCHVKFNGENFYLKRIPTSSKSNEDARYKYDLDFVSERVILEQVYMYDVVQPFVTEKPISESATFSFYGDITELAKRVNASLIRSGLASLMRKYVAYPTNPSATVPYLTYEQWNQMNVDPSPLIGTVFTNAGEMQTFGQTIYSPLQGNYNSYLLQYIYENDNGVYTLSGYRVVIGDDKYGETTSSDEMLVSFENNTIHEALQQFHDTYELEYYITMEKDGNGDLTGNTLIVVGDCEHDFADWDGDTDDYVRDDDGVPTTESPFDYGASDELLMKEKTNTTDKIVTRITGVGSTENIPWYYPNPNPDGWIKPVFKSGGIEQANVTIEYPTDEGSTVAESVVYERFLKNRIGVPIKRGVLVDLKNALNTYQNNANGIINEGNTRFVYTQYFFHTVGITAPFLSLEMAYPPDSNCYRFVATLKKSNNIVGQYDSNETYTSPTEFQAMMANKNGKDATTLDNGHKYVVTMRFYLSSIPLSETYEYSGYHYPSTRVEIPVSGGSSFWSYVGENFYEEEDLQPFVRWAILGGTTFVIYDAGYSTDGTPEGKVMPIPRVEGRKYRDLDSETIYICTTSQTMSTHNDFWYGTNKDAYKANPKMGWREWLSTFVSMSLRLYSNNGWYIGLKAVDLADYGLEAPKRNGSEFDYGIFDEIAFQRTKYVTPQPNLMPEVYIKTDGERRYYNAHDYWDKANETLLQGTADEAVGEAQVGAMVRNPIYKADETDADSGHYDFENEYIQQLPHEHIETMDDVKPTIKEQTNTVDGNVIRIDVVEEFAYDLTDNNEIWESNEEGGSGEYKHPYFFAKLRPMGFNIFDLALQDDMVLSMTTGHCGACNFKIGVDENTKKNPLQLWPYDVYEGDDFEMKTLKYQAGELRRYVNAAALYYDTDGTAEGYTPVDGNSPNSDGLYDSYTYSAEDVANGYVGSMKQSGKRHFEGDVVTSGRFMDSQQDTSENYVWVALMKDTDTYGVIMPSAMPNYNNTTLNNYIEPKGINYTNRATGETSALSEDDADKFVLTNIRLPQMYLRRAERLLSRKLVAYMYDNNYQKFNFSINLSRIFIAENEGIDDNLNENSVVYVNFNRHTYRQYAKHYTYRMSHDAPLPEISVDMNEELSVSRTLTQQQAYYKQVNNRWLLSQMGAMTQQMQERIGRKTVSKTDDSVVSANIVLKDTGTSLVETSNASAAASIAVEVIQTEITTGEVGGVLEWEEF